MSKLSSILCDDDQYSWRKIMTAGCLLVYLTAQMGYLITYHFAELPTAYWVVDASVFAFYFAKKSIENIIQNNKQ
jgi:uncharacterized protein YybS (DUF2232 family)